MTLQERLQKIQSENARKKEEKNRIEGKIEALKQQAQKEFGVSEIEDLESLVKQLEPELEAKELEIKQALERMENYANL
jgi:hypothetical protein